MAALDSNCVPAVHSVSLEHTRSEVPVGSTEAYSLAAHLLSAAHLRLERWLGGVLWYSSPSTHTLKRAHCLSEVALAGTASYSSAEHKVYVGAVVGALVGVLVGALVGTGVGVREGAGVG